MSRLYLQINEGGEDGSLKQSDGRVLLLPAFLDEIDVGRSQEVQVHSSLVIVESGVCLEHVWSAV